MEVGIGAALRCEAHQPRTPIRLHVRSVSENPDTPMGFALRVERPSKWRAEKMILQHPLDSDIRQLEFVAHLQ